MELGLKIRFLAPSPCFSHHTRLPYILSAQSMFLLNLSHRLKIPTFILRKTTLPPGLCSWWFSEPLILIHIIDFASGYKVFFT